MALMIIIIGSRGEGVTKTPIHSFICEAIH